MKDEREINKNVQIHKRTIIFFFVTNDFSNYILT